MASYVPPAEPIVVRRTVRYRVRVALMFAGFALIGVAVAVGVVPSDTDTLLGKRTVAFGCLFVLSTLVVAIDVSRGGGARLVAGPNQVELSSINRIHAYATHEIESLSIAEIPLLPWSVLRLQTVREGRQPYLVLGSDELTPALQRWISRQE